MNSLFQFLNILLCGLVLSIINVPHMLALSSSVWYKTKFGSQNLATKFDNHLCIATKIGSQC